MTILDGLRATWFAATSVTTVLVTGAATVNVCNRALRDDPPAHAPDRVALSERDAALNERNDAVRAQKLAELRAVSAELKLNELIRGGIFLPVKPAGGEVRPQDLIPAPLPGQEFPIPTRPVEGRP